MFDNGVLSLKFLFSRFGHDHVDTHYNDANSRPRPKMAGLHFKVSDSMVMVAEIPVSLLIIWTGNINLSILP